MYSVDVFPIVGTVAVGILVVVGHRTFTVHHGAHYVVGGVGVRCCSVVVAAEGDGLWSRRHSIHLARYGTTTVCRSREGREGDIDVLCSLAVVAAIVGNPICADDSLVAGARDGGVAA